KASWRHGRFDRFRPGGIRGTRLLRTVALGRVGAQPGLAPLPRWTMMARARHHGRGVARLYDPTTKVLGGAGPEAWPALLGLPRAPTDVLDADIATVTGAADKVLRVRGTPPYLLHLEFQAGHDTARLPGLLHLRHTLLEHRHDLLVRSVAVL